MYDLTSSGLNLFEGGAHYPNTKRIAIHDTSPNYGLVDIDWNTKTASLEVHNDKGVAVISKSVRF